MILRQINVATSDERGTISDILYKGVFHHAAVIETTVKSGPVIRGNHYHKQSEQHIYMLDGWLAYWWQSIDSVTGERVGDVQRVVVPQGWMVTSPAYEIHALEFWSDARFVVFTSGVRGGEDYESDTFRVVPILTLQNLSISNLV